MVTWHLTMKLFPAKCHERATLRKLWRQTGNSSVRCCTWWLESQRSFQICFCFVLLYNKSLNDWSLGEQWILFPLNLNVSLDFVSGNIEILGKQNSLFPRDQSLSVYCFALRKRWRVYLFPVLDLLIKCLVTKLQTNQNVHQVLLYVNSTEKWTGMKNTGLKMPEEDQIYL